MGSRKFIWRWLKGLWKQILDENIALGVRQQFHPNFIQTSDDKPLSDKPSTPFIYSTLDPRLDEKHLWRKRSYPSHALQCMSRRCSSNPNHVSHWRKTVFSLTQESCLGLCWKVPSLCLGAQGQLKWTSEKLVGFGTYITRGFPSLRYLLRESRLPTTCIWHAPHLSRSRPQSHNRRTRKVLLILGAILYAKRILWIVPWSRLALRVEKSFNLNVAELSVHWVDWLIWLTWR